MFIKNEFTIWKRLSFIIALVVLIPFVILLSNVFIPIDEAFKTILTYWMKDYIINTSIILLFTGLFTAILGSTMAMIFSFFDFPLKKILEVLIVLPLSIPTYVLAYVYSDLFSYTGMIQTFLRNILHVTPNQKYFSFLNVRGIIFIFTLSLYPYVYLIVRSYLKNNNQQLFENARMLGLAPYKIFVKLIFPITIPIILGGTILVWMEVLSDYGVASYFGIHTFATAIFQTWFGMQDVSSAIKIALIILLFSVILVFLNNFLKNPKKQEMSGKNSSFAQLPLRKGAGVLFFITISVLLLLAFFIPVIQLVIWAWMTYRTVWNKELVVVMSNTFLLAAIGTGIVFICSIIVTNTERIDRSKRSKVYESIASLGYPTPSTVLGLGILVLFKILDPYTTKNLLSSGLWMVVFGYTVKFLTVGIQGVSAGFDKVGTKYLDNARMLGVGVTKSFFKVDLFLIQPALIRMTLMVFIDMVKELPLVLLLKPYNFNTLSTKIYYYAGDEQIKKAAIPALILICMSLLFSVLITGIEKKKG